MFQHSFYRRFLASFLGMVFLTCALLSVVWVSFLLRALNAAMEEDQYDRLCLAVNDLDRQIEIMDEISLNISVSIYYKSIYINRNKYFETDLIADFAKYTNRSPLVVDYFLLYQGSEWIFRSNAKTLYSAYAKTEFPHMSPQAIYEDVQARQSPAILSGGNGRWIYVCPLALNVLHGPIDARLCFVLNEETLLTRIYAMAGNLEGEVAVLYGAQRLTSGSHAIDGFPIMAHGESFTIAFLPESSAFFGLLRQMQRLNISVLLAIVAILTLAAAWTANAIYRPIWRLLAKYNLSIRRDRTDEIQHIDLLLGNALNRNSLSHRQIEELATQLREQESWIRRQILLSLFHGNLAHDCVEQLMQNGVNLRGPAYCAIVVHSNAPDREELIALIEALSSEEIRYYGLPLREKNWTAIAAGFPIDVPPQRLVDEICELGANTGHCLFVCAGTICDSPACLPESLVSALSAAAQPAAKDGIQAEKGNAEVSMAIARLQEGSLEEAIEYFDKAIYANREMDGMLQGKFWTLNAFGALFRFAVRVGYAVPNHVITAVLSCQKEEGFIQMAHSLLRAIHGHISNQREQESKLRCSELLEYIDAHLLDDNFSLTQVEEAFHLSGKQISRILKAGTGVTFIDCVTAKKISRAKFMLADAGLTVAETSRRLKYSSVPYFMKAFKAATGITPGAWKKAHSTDEQAP